MNVENLVPIPRNIRGGRTSSMIKVPAPTLVIIAVIVNYRREYNRKKKERAVRPIDDGLGITLLDMRGSGFGPRANSVDSLNHAYAWHVTRDRVIPQTLRASENHHTNTCSLSHVFGKDGALRFPPTGGISLAHTAQTFIIRFA